eukprot:gene19516-25412_t
MSTALTTINDLKEKTGNIDSLKLPTDDEALKVAEKTKLALEAILHGKILSSKPLDITRSEEAEPTYIRYTSNPNAPGANGVSQQRVIKMVEAQIDPMEPPKHKIKKVPRGPAEEPVPVLHSPPRKLTVADQQAWKIPPCISNWKNSKGFIIPLDKRLAADGRGLQEVTINNKFATLSEALYVAERKASEDLRIRNTIRKKMAVQEKEDKEKELRDMATKARLERAGVLQGVTHPNNHDSYNKDIESGSESDEEEIPRNETEYERAQRLERETIRVERRKERERELRLENMKGKLQKSKLGRDEGRDISEKIALGLHKGTGKLTGEALFDSRLFNQSAGLSSGFGPDDEYNTFTKPLFDKAEASSIYRPKKSDTDIYGDVDTQMAKLSDTSRFRPDKGFKGAEGGVNAGPRDAPVQFERSDNEKSKRSRYE